MITANDLKTKGIACLEESLANQPEAVITVRGKESFVVMRIDHYHYLREMELEAALYETQQDLVAGRFSKESIDDHVAALFTEWATAWYLPTATKNALSALQNNILN